MTREELHAKAWTAPMSALAKELAVSGSYLARVCARLSVPRPPRGYWAKRAVGRAPAITPLPDIRPGELDALEPGQPLAASVMPPQAPHADAPRQRVRIPRGQVHGLVAGAKAHFLKTRPIKKDGYLKPFKKRLVDITVSEACLDPALGLASDLFNTLTRAGHRVAIVPESARLQRGEIDIRVDVEGPKRDEWYALWSPWRPTVVHVGTVAIGLAVVEMSECVTMRYLKGDYVREADFQRFRREDDARQAAQARRDSEEQLSDIIAQWSKRMDIERFFEGVEARVNALPPAERARKMRVDLW